MFMFHSFLSWSLRVEANLCSYFIGYTNVSVFLLEIHLSFNWLNPATVLCLVPMQDMDFQHHMSLCICMPEDNLCLSAPAGIHFTYVSRRYFIEPYPSYRTYKLLVSNSIQITFLSPVTCFSSIHVSVLSSWPDFL